MKFKIYERRLDPKCLKCKSEMRYDGVDDEALKLKCDNCGREERIPLNKQDLERYRHAYREK